MCIVTFCSSGCQVGLWFILETHNKCKFRNSPPQQSCWNNFRQVVILKKKKKKNHTPVAFSWPSRDVSSFIIWVLVREIQLFPPSSGPAHCRSAQVLLPSDGYARASLRSHFAFCSFNTSLLWHNHQKQAEWDSSAAGSRMRPNAQIRSRHLSPAFMRAIRALNTRFLMQQGCFKYSIINLFITVWGKNHALQIRWQSSQTILSGFLSRNAWGILSPIPSSWSPFDLLASFRSALSEVWRRTRVLQLCESRHLTSVPWLSRGSHCTQEIFQVLWLQLNFAGSSR